MKTPPLPFAVRSMGKTTTFVDLDVHREGWHVQIPSYKEEYKDGDGGYHVENGRPAKPIGAYWMTLYRRRGGRGYGVEFTKARN